MIGFVVLLQVLGNATEALGVTNAIPMPVGARLRALAAADRSAGSDRTCLPLLIASDAGVLVNTSSVNGFWASLGPGMPNTAYATAKLFAVKGFTEALIEDLCTHAPHVRAVVVIPGQVATDIIANTRRAHQHPEPHQMTDAQLRELIPAEAKARLIRAGALTDDAFPEDLRQLLARQETAFRDTAPLSATAAATPILEGVRAGAWRILLGEDAAAPDAAVRAQPEAAYDYPALAKAASRVHPRRPTDLSPSQPPAATTPPCA